MSGAIWAALAGIGFGFFQAFNRKARAGFDVYWATFILLFVSAVTLSLAAILTADFSILRGASLIAIVNLGLAGFIHFFLGWTLLTISQNRVGAARTGALVGATPLFATIVAIVALDEILSPLLLIGVIIVVAGVYFVTFADKGDNDQVSANWRDYLYGLGVALCFAISPIFIRSGLEAIPSPLLGVAIGMTISAAAYGVLLLLRRDRLNMMAVPGNLLVFQLAAGLLVGLSTWMRWIALELAPVAVVLALGRLNVPVVILLSIFLVGQQQERVTGRVWLGAALIVFGSLILIFAR